MSETLFIGKNRIELDSIDSTNSYVANLLRDSNVIEGTVVTSHFQESGRGQRGSSWESNPGENLMFTIVFKPNFLSVNNSFLLSKIVALGIYNYLESISIDDVYIKWPNDILVGDKKICGVLIENQYKGTKIENSIVGIGFNVNQVSFGNLTTATSLKLLTQQDYSLNSVLDNLLSHIEAVYLRAKSKNSFEIEKEYLQNLLYHDEFKRYNLEDSTITGKITGVMPEGKLKMELQNGEVQLYSFKEIEFIL